MSKAATSDRQRRGDKSKVSITRSPGRTVVTASPTFQHSGALVAEDTGKREREVAAPGGRIGVAHPRGLHPHEDLVPSWVPDFDLAQGELRAALLHQGCRRLGHLSPSFLSGWLGDTWGHPARDPVG
jgi:hypothetical protein